MVEQDDRFQKAMNQGNSAAWDQDWARAADFYRQALDIDHENQQALTNLGLALFELHDYPAALRCYQQIARTNQSSSLPWEKMAAIYVNIGQLSQASVCASQAAELYLKDHDLTKALDNWKAAVEWNPDNLQAHSRLALVYERNNQKDLAIREYLGIASLCQQSGQKDNARRSLMHSLELVPRHPEIESALVLLDQDQPLPKIKYSKPITGSKPIPSPLTLDAPKTIEASVDPCEGANIMALATLANMLFESMEAKPPTQQVGRGGIAAIMQGMQAGSTKSTDQALIKLYLSQAIDLISSNQIPQAAEELERAIEAGLDDAAAAYELGNLKFKMERLESAMRSLQQAVKHPNYALAARLLLGQILQRLGKTKEAAIEFLEALRIADTSQYTGNAAHGLFQLYEPIIETQRQEKDVEKQRKVVENISTLLLRPDWQVQLGLLRQRNPEAAGDTLFPLAEILSEDLGNRLVSSMSRVYQFTQNGHTASAMEEAFFGLEEAPTYLPLHVLMGELLVKQGLTEEAIQKFVTVARSYISRGEAARAVEIYRKVVQLAPMDENIHKQLIDQLVAMGQIEEAVQEYHNYAEICYNQADVENARRAYNEALKLAKKAHLDNQILINIYVKLADVDVQSLEWRAAMQDYEQIRALQPDDRLANQQLIAFNLRLGQEAQAIQVLDGYLVALNNKGLSSEAIPVIEELLRENGAQTFLHIRLAELYQRGNKVADAIREYEIAVEIYLETKNRQGAIQVILSILALNPSNSVEYQKRLAQLKSPPNVK